MFVHVNVCHVCSCGPGVYHVHVEVYCVHVAVHHVCSYGGISCSCCGAFCSYGGISCSFGVYFVHMAVYPLHLGCILFMWRCVLFIRRCISKHEVVLQDQNSERGNSPRFTPITNDRSGTEMLREEQRKLAEQEELAATKIQAGFRGYKTRKELKQKQAEEEFSRGRESMASLMRDDPIPLNGDDDWGPGPAADNHVEAEEKAAITLQAGFRGYKARQEVKEMRANQEVKDKGEETPPPPQQIPPARQQSPPSPVANDPALAKSATPTQTMANDISQAEAEHAAAAKIQATFRGHQTRKELAGAQTAGPEEVASTEGSEQNSSTQH